MNNKDGDTIYQLDAIYSGAFPAIGDEKIAGNIGSNYSVPINLIANPFLLENKKSAVELVYENGDRKLIEIEINNPYNVHQWLLEEIDDFEQLPPNWDGYGGIAVLPEIAEHARNLVRVLDDYFLERVTDIFSNSHGTITIEWEKDNEEKLSLEIGKNNYSYFVRYNYRDPKPVDGQNIFSDIKALTQDIRELFGETTPF